MANSGGVILGGGEKNSLTTKTTSTMTDTTESIIGTSATILITENESDNDINNITSCKDNLNNIINVTNCSSESKLITTILIPTRCQKITNDDSKVSTDAVIDATEVTGKKI